MAFVTSKISYCGNTWVSLFLPTAHQLYFGHHFLAGCISVMSATARSQLLAPQMYKPSDRPYPEAVDSSPPWLSNLAANCTHKHLTHCLAAAVVRNIPGCSMPVILFQPAAVASVSPAAALASAMSAAAATAGISHDCTTLHLICVHGIQPSVKLCGPCLLFPRLFKLCSPTWTAVSSS